MTKATPRPTIQPSITHSKEVNLQGKTVFICGNDLNAGHWADLLEERGATIKYPKIDFPESFGLSQEQASGVSHEIAAMNPKPDMVVIVHPAMDLSGSLEQSPGLSLAQQMKDNKISTLIIDDFEREQWGAPSQVQLQTIKASGAEFIGMCSADSKRHFGKIIEMLTAPKASDLPPH